MNVLPGQGEEVSPESSVHIIQNSYEDFRIREQD